MNRLKVMAAVCFTLLGAGSMSAQEGFHRRLTIDELFQLASENSRQLKVAASGVEVAKSATRVIRNSRLPVANATLSASYLGDATLTDRDYTHIQRISMPHFGNNFVLEASQVIFAGGAISNRIAAAELQEQLSQLGYQQQEQEVRFLLLGYYLELYKLTNMRDIYTRNISQSKLLLSQMQSRRQEGMALRSDLTRYELMIQDYDLTLTEINDNCRILNRQLTSALGLSDTTVIDPDTTIVHRSLEPLTSELLLKTAGEHAPAIQSAAMGVQVAGKEVALAKSEYMPTLALVAENNFGGPITIEVPVIDKNLNYWYVGLGLKYNISSLYTSGKSVQMARARQQAAISEEELVNEQSALAIHDAFIKYQESILKLPVLEKSKQLANENFEIIQQRYLNNLVLITEMLDASNTKVNSELVLENARISLLYNFYHLRQIAGTI